ncbi:unnamed protein product [Echinostoma caproni]|uniref:Cyclin_C domain-containing protein n=1 Tax=Echinostoma caproni TaxID=27848 RepID=A0A183AFM3_9TREM|nr:unnamed protein product [Echinostoma caproni]
MMVTGTRGVVRVLGSTGGDIPKALITSVKCSKKSRRCKKRTENREHSKRSDSVQSSFSPALRPSDEGASVPLFLEAKCTLPGYVATPSIDENGRTRFILHEKLYSLLTQEGLMHADTSHLLSVNAEFDDKVDAPLRQETLSKLWCLHSAFYGLSTSIFCKAVCLMDSFISRVKDVLLPTPDSLVTLSRCGGTTADLTRMVEIILSKLSPANVAAIGACPATACEFLQTFITFGLWGSGAPPCGHLHSVNSSRLSSFSRQLEVSITSAEAASFRPSCLALALLSMYCLPTSSTEEISCVGPNEELHFTVPDLFNLAQLCGIHWADVDACRVAIRNAVVTSTGSSDIQDYPASRLLGSSPPLVWTLSRRTQRIMSSSQVPTLPTILETEEQIDEVQSTLGNLVLPAFE